MSQQQQVLCQRQTEVSCSYNETWQQLEQTSKCKPTCAIVHKSIICRTRCSEVTTSSSRTDMRFTTLWGRHCSSCRGAAGPPAAAAQLHLKCAAPGTVLASGVHQISFHGPRQRGLAACAVPAAAHDHPHALGCCAAGPAVCLQTWTRCQNPSTATRMLLPLQPGLEENSTTTNCYETNYTRVGQIIA